MYDYADTKIYLYHSHRDQTANIEEVPLKQMQESKHDTTYMDIIRTPVLPFPWSALNNASYSAVFIRPRSSIGMWHVVVTYLHYSYYDLVHYLYSGVLLPSYLGNHLYLLIQSIGRTY